MKEQQSIAPNWEEKNAPQAREKRRNFSNKFGARRDANEEGILAERARRAEVSDRVSNKVLHQIGKKKMPRMGFEPVSPVPKTGTLSS